MLTFNSPVTSARAATRFLLQRHDAAVLSEKARVVACADVAVIIAKAHGERTGENSDLWLLVASLVDLARDSSLRRKRLRLRAARKFSWEEAEFTLRLRSFLLNGNKLRLERPEPARAARVSLCTVSARTAARQRTDASSKGGSDGVEGAAS